MHTMPLPRLHRAFRTLGVRHIFVTDTRNEVMGVITRKDLCAPPSPKPDPLTLTLRA